jgi:hypothetical protein
MISDEGKASLVRLVSKEEVYTAFTQMDFFKAPSTNGFQAFFFKKNIGTLLGRMCGIWLPNATCMQIDKIVMKFIWGNQETRRSWNFD